MALGSSLATVKGGRKRVRWDSLTGIVNVAVDTGVLEFRVSLIAQVRDALEDGAAGEFV